MSRTRKKDYWDKPKKGWKGTGMKRRENKRIRRIKDIPVIKHWFYGNSPGRH